LDQRRSVERLTYTITSCLLRAVGRMAALMRLMQKSGA
jgi:hypothetical protein